MDKMDKIDTLFKLAESSWIELEKRRTYEWQINFSFWAGISIVTGFSFEKNLILPCCSIVFFIFIGLIYIYFQFGLFKSNRKDQRKRYHYLSDIHYLNNISKPDGFDEVPCISKYLFTNYSHVSQIIITLMFLSFSFLVITRSCLLFPHSCPFVCP